MRKYIIRHSSIEGWTEEITAINSEVVNYCHEFYIEGINGKLLIARRAILNWDIFHVEYPKEMIK